MNVLSPKRVLGGLFFLISILALLALTTVSILGFWGADYWRCDTLAHFRVQYLILALFLAFIFSWKTQWFRLGWALVLALINGWVIFQWPENTSPLPERPVYKALAYNVYTRNDDIQATGNFIREEKPDFVFLTEVTRDWEPLLKELEPEYPYQKKAIHGPQGSVLLSRYPFVQEKHRFAGVGSLHGQVTLPDGQRLVLLGVHPISPRSEKEWEWRNSALRDIGQFCQEQTAPILLLGDLNCSPFSPNFDFLLEKSGLRDPKLSWMPVATWPTWNPLMKIPIDHFLVSSDISVLAEWAGPHLGSDHLPILILFQVERASPARE